MIVGHVDMDLTEVFAIAIKDLDAGVAAVSYVDVSLIIGRDTVGRVELPGTGPRFSPGFDPVAILVHFGDARVDVAVADVRVASRIPCYVSDLPELAVDWRQRRTADVS